jgi:hypothetical protein
MLRDGIMYLFEGSLGRDKGASEPWVTVSTAPAHEHYTAYRARYSGESENIMDEY